MDVHPPHEPVHGWRIEANLALLAAAQNRKPAIAAFDQHWGWDSPASVAWEAARGNGAVVLMPYEVSEAWSAIHSQQASVNTQSMLYVRDIYRLEGPLSRGRELTDLRPEELGAMVADEHQLLADLRLLRDLCHSLDNVYRNAEKSVD